MIDLNVRLETSLVEQDYRFLASKMNKELNDDFFKAVQLPYDQTNVEGFKKAREEVLTLLQSEEAITYAVNSLVHRFYQKGYLYFELAFTPFLFANTGLSVRRRVKTLMNALNDSLKECPGMDVNVILYCHRGDAFLGNLEVANLALEYRNERIVAVGLEGDDKAHPMVAYEKLFAKAKEENFPVVIELGRSYSSNKSILKAVEIGAKRIVSPYKFIPDVKVLSSLSEKNVYFEFRPSFDVVNGYNDKLDNLPINRLCQYGFRCYISGNAYGVLDASLVNEFSRLNSFTREDVQRSIQTTVNAAYIANKHQKTMLVNHFVKEFNRFYEPLAKPYK